MPPPEQRQLRTFPPRILAVSNRASTRNLLVSLLAYLVFMIVLLEAIGFGVGTPELLIWLAVLVIGSLLIFRRYRHARADVAHPSGS